jgi:hypothetical protein
MPNNGINFGPDLLMSAKVSASLLPKIGMAWHPWASRNQHHSSASLIRPIWRIFKGLEAADMVCFNNNAAPAAARNETTHYAFYELQEACYIMFWHCNIN